MLISFPQWKAVCSRDTSASLQGQQARSRLTMADGRVTPDFSAAFSSADVDLKDSAHSSSSAVLASRVHYVQNVYSIQNVFLVQNVYLFQNVYPIQNQFLVQNVYLKAVLLSLPACCRLEGAATWSYPCERCERVGGGEDEERRPVQAKMNQSQFREVLVLAKLLPRAGRLEQDRLTHPTGSKKNEMDAILFFSAGSFCLRPQPPI